jgi:hypothetical protein
MIARLQMRSPGRCTWRDPYRHFADTRPPAAGSPLLVRRSHDIGAALQDERFPNHGQDQQPAAQRRVWEKLTSRQARRSTVALAARLPIAAVRNRLTITAPGVPKRRSERPTAGRQGPASRAFRDCRRWRQHARRDTEAGAARLGRRLSKLPTSATARLYFRLVGGMRKSASTGAIASADG